MRFKNGGPVQIYALVNQDTGEIEIAPTLPMARKWKKVSGQLGVLEEIITYVQKERK